MGKWLADRKADLGFESIAPLVDEDYASIKLVDRGRNKGKVISNAKMRSGILLSGRPTKTGSLRFASLTLLCGSGELSNEVFDFLFREGQVINRTLETFYGGQGS